MAVRFSPLTRDAGGALRTLAPLLLIGAGGIVIARGLATTRVDMALTVAAALAVFILAFLRTEIGLYLVVFSMLLSPEFGGGGALAENRTVVFRGEDLLLMIIALSWLAKTAINKEIGLVLKTPLNRPIFAYVAVTAIATTLGYVAGTVRTSAGFFYVLKYVEYFFVYYMVVNNVTGQKQARRLVITAFATAAIVSVIGIMQIPSGERVSAPFEGEEGGEPNTFGGYLLFIMALCFGIALETRSMRTRLVSLALSGLCALPFAFTLSRASYLGLPFVLIVVGLLSRRRQMALAIIVFLLFLSPLLAWVVPDAVVKRVQFTFQPEKGAPSVRLGKVGFDASTSARFISMQQAWEGWQRRPLLGYGVTGFSFMDAQYARTLVETGLIGFAALGWLVLVLLRTGLATYRAVRDPDDRGLALGFIAGTVGLLIHAIGSNTFIIIRIMEPFWLFAGIVVLLPSLEQTASQPAGPEGMARLADAMADRPGTPRGTRWGV